MSGKCCSASEHHVVPPPSKRNTPAGVIIGERYARNPSGKLSHSRKELLVRPVKEERFASASILASCPDQLWLIDKSPDVILWSAKVRDLECIDFCLGLCDSFN
jgi:hypothetical protein